MLFLIANVCICVITLAIIYFMLDEIKFQVSRIMCEKSDFHDVSVRLKRLESQMDGKQDKIVAVFNSEIEAYLKERK